MGGTPYTTEGLVQCALWKVLHKAHNHPSGNLKPSHADLELTKKISRAGQLLDISVNDHLIITSEGFYSFAEEGLM
jgi:DNA repair protein RadC